MKGVIFNAVEHAVIGLGGDDLWDDLLESAGLEGAYSGMGDYPDEELVALVTAASQKLELPASDVLKTVGRAAFSFLASRVPDLVAQVSGPLELLSSVHDVIHVQVKMLYPDAKPPELEHQILDDGSLRLTYQSHRNLGDLAIGLMHGAGDHYEVELDIAIEKEDAATGTVVFLVRELAGVRS